MKKIVCIFLISLAACNNNNYVDAGALYAKWQKDSLRMADSLGNTLAINDAITNPPPQKDAVKDSIISFDKIDDSVLVLEIFPEYILYDKKEGWLFKPEVKDGDRYTSIRSAMRRTETDTVYTLSLSSPPFYHNCNSLINECSASLLLKNGKWLLVDSQFGSRDETSTRKTFVNGPYIISKNEWAGSHCQGMYYAGVNYDVMYKGKNVNVDFSYDVDNDDGASERAIIDENDPESECSTYKSYGSGKLKYDKKRKALIFNSINYYVQYSGHTCSDSTFTKTVKTEVCYKDYHEVISEVKTGNGKTEVIKKKTVDDFIKQCETPGK